MYIEIYSYLAASGVQLKVQFKFVNRLINFLKSKLQGPTS